MSNATRLIDWYLGETLRLAAASMTDPAVAAANRLLDWLQGRSEAKISLRTICQFGPNELRSKACADAAMMFVSLPIVLHVSEPCCESMMTRVRAAVAVAPSRMRTL